MAKEPMEYADVIKKLEALGTPENVAGMARFGIKPEHALGVTMPNIRKLAREAGRDHALALRLWGSGFNEARILASLMEDPALVTEEQAESWVSDFNSWDVCDQVCMNLFWLTPFAYYCRACTTSASSGLRVRRSSSSARASR